MAASLHQKRILQARHTLCKTCTTLLIFHAGSALALGSKLPLKCRSKQTWLHRLRDMKSPTIPRDKAPSSDVFKWLAIFSWLGAIVRTTGIPISTHNLWGLIAGSNWRSRRMSLFLGFLARLLVLLDSLACMEGFNPCFKLLVTIIVAPGNDMVEQCNWDHHCLLGCSTASYTDWYLARQPNANHLSP